MVFRYGGEEFAVIITETSLENAVIPLERLRKSIQEQNFIYDGNNIKITISIGVSEITEQIKTVHELFETADKALFKSKQNGRNQINP